MAEIKQDGNDVLYSNAAFVEDENLKNSFKAAVKDAGYYMRWDKEDKAFRIEDAKQVDIARINREHTKVKEQASEKSSTGLVIKQDGNDVLYSNTDFVEDEKLKNSFKAAVKDAGYKMKWDKEEKAFRIEDAKLKNIIKINTKHTKVKEQASEKSSTGLVIKQDGNDVLYSNADFVEDEKLKNSFKKAVKDAGYYMRWDKEDKAFRIEDAKQADIAKIDKNHTKVKEKTEQKVDTGLVIKQDGNDVLYSNTAFVEDENLKNSFKAAVKDAGYKMKWDKEDKAFRIEDAKLKNIIKINTKNTNIKEKAAIKIDKAEWNVLVKTVDKINSNMKMKQN